MKVLVPGACRGSHRLSVEVDQEEHQVAQLIVVSRLALTVLVVGVVSL